MPSDYNPTKRQQNPAYLVRHADEMKKLAIHTSSSSLLIYSCLDLRTTLEFIEINILLASVSEPFRQEILDTGKGKNGIDRVNKKIKTLKEKYQLFYQAICEILKVPGKFYDFKKSDDLQFQLSQYLHTYTRDQSEIEFESAFMQASIKIINETIKFIFDSLEVEPGRFKIQNMDVHQIPLDDLRVFEEFKNSTMTYENLKDRLQNNHDKRIHGNS